MQRLKKCFPNEHLVVTTDFSEYTKAFVQNCTVSNYETETFLVKQDWINQMTHIFLLFRYTKFSRKRNHRGTIFSNILSNPTLSIESLWPSLLTSSSSILFTVAVYCQRELNLSIGLIFSVGFAISEPPGSSCFSIFRNFPVESQNWVSTTLTKVLAKILKIHLSIPQNFIDFYIILVSENVALDKWNPVSTTLLGFVRRIAWLVLLLNLLKNVVFS